MQASMQRLLAANTDLKESLVKEIRDIPDLLEGIMQPVNVKLDEIGKDHTVR